MEQSLISHKIQRTPQEWNADLYAKGNKVQYESALHFLQHNKINLDHKHILDVGCGTGDISVFMATKAALVHGLDASKNMVEYSTEKYKHINNLSFEQSFAENFTSQNKTYDLATIFFCFHWLFDKRQALTQISQSLTAHGTLFGTFPTLDDQKLQRFIIAKQMLTELYPHHSLSEKLDRSESTLEELKIMLAETGFEIITCELQTNEVILPNREAFEDFQRPVAMSRPFIKEMSSEKAEAFFQEFITRVIPTMQQTEDGQLIEEMTTRIIHARKK
jgi:ubiquinone/menaquinone biosynthesis C-methylase UbiE